MEHRSEKIVLETDRYRIAGTMTLPKAGYRSRLSDFLNQGDVEFLPLTDVEIAPLDGGEAESQEFLAVSLRHISIIHPAEGS